MPEETATESLPEAPKAKQGGATKIKPGQKLNPTGKGGFGDRPRSDKAGSKIVQYRKNLSIAVRKSLSSNRIKDLLEKVYDHAMSGDEGWQKSAEMIFDRAMGKPKVDVGVEVSGTVSFEQRIAMAKMVTGLVVHQLEVPSLDTHPAETEDDSKRLPFIDSVASVRTVSGEDAGNLLHPEQEQLEGLHREFLPSPEAADYASQPTESGNPQEPEVAEIVG